MRGDRPEQGLTHFNEEGASRMVDVSGKPVTLRTARALARVKMSPSTMRLIRDRQLAKGDVFEVSRLGGIMAAKQTGFLIPLCHPLVLDAVEVDVRPEDEETLRIETTVRATGRTGVEMEALTAAALAALTVYDMCKAVERGIVISEIRLLEKTGGTRGPWRANPADDAPADPPHST